MLTKIKLLLRPTAPRLLLLDHPGEDGERRAAVIYPDRLPIIFATLTHAVDALRSEVAS